MSDSEPDYKSRLNSLNKLTIVSGAKSQVQDAQGNLKRKYARRNIRIPNNKSEKLADTFGTPLKASKIKSGDFTDNMKWNVYKTDVEPKLMNKMVENDDENMKRIVEAALADENINQAEIVTVDQATLDRERAEQMRIAHKEAKYIEKLSKRNNKREEIKNQIEESTQEYFDRKLEADLARLAGHESHPEYDRYVQKAYNKNQNLRKDDSEKVSKIITDHVKNLTRSNIKEEMKKAKVLREEKGAEKAAEKAERIAKKAERKAEIKAEIKAEKAAKEQAKKDAKAAKIAKRDEKRQERINTEIAQQSEIQAQRAAKRAEQAKAKAEYDARVAIEKAKPGAATLIQNAFRSKKARDALTTQKQKAIKYNEFLGEREVMKSELKSKSANLTASYGENLFPRAKVGRPPGSTNKSKQRTGAKTVLRGMVAKGKKPTP